MHLTMLIAHPYFFCISMNIHNTRLLFNWSDTPPPNRQHTTANSTPPTTNNTRDAPSHHTHTDTHYATRSARPATHPTPHITTGIVIENL